jgi:Ni/Fe-hydrogenase subunit HybB-like protein
MFMVEKALRGGRRYRLWIFGLLLTIAVGFACYLRQLDQGLAITGLSPDVTWGLYIAQYTFLAGVAASAVVAVVPCCLHRVREFARIAILAECLAIAAVIVSMMFIVVDLGQPARVFNVLLYPTPNSPMFWDMISLGGYLVLNLVIFVATLRSEREETAPPRWLEPVVLLYIPWAVSMPTVAAFLYGGLPGRPLWLSAALAPRFLASAFASGASLLILLSMLLRKLANSPPAVDVFRKLSLVVAWAMAINVFFVLMEFFTAFNSAVPEHVEPLRYMFLGLDGRHALAPWMWVSMLLAAGSLVLLIVPRYRQNPSLLAIACGMVFLSLWMDKGMGLIVAGFVPSPLGAVTEYAPSLPEALISLGIWAAGMLILTVLCKIGRLSTLSAVNYNFAGKQKVRL